MLRDKILDIDHNSQRDKLSLIADIVALLGESSYHVVEVDDGRPWGGFIRIDNADAERFVGEFFPGLPIDQARLGNPDAPLSPKILIVSPDQRLSWQYHHRRAERWAFLTSGAYCASPDDALPEPTLASTGEVVQFSTGERHRLIGLPAERDSYVLVAEIWQHTDPTHLSDEDDIVRVSDDYQR